MFYTSYALCGFTKKRFCVSDLSCFNFVDDKLEGGIGEINPMMEFMPHSTSGAPYSFSHASNFVNKHSPTHPTPAMDPLKYLLEELRKLPTINEQETPSSSGAHKSFPAKNFPPMGRSRLTAGSVKATPMRHYEDFINVLFKYFKKNFKKKYSSKHEHEMRKDIYRHNLR